MTIPASRIALIPSSLAARRGGDIPASRVIGRAGTVPSSLAINRGIAESFYLRILGRLVRIAGYLVRMT